MKSFFEDIYAYHYSTNQKLLKHLSKSDITVPAKVQKLLSHSILAHKLWNTRILKNLEEITFSKIHSLNHLTQTDAENYKNTLDILHHKDLTDIIHYNSTSGKAYENSIQEILTQISQHFQYHRGQIITELLKHKIQIKPTDYIYFKRKALH